MNSFKTHPNITKKKYLAVILPLAMAAQVQGFEFFMGEIEGSLDSQLSMGSSWRLEQQDSRLTQGISGTQTLAENENEGDLNYEKSDIFSNIVKGSHDLQVKYQNYGAFVRGKYWYDQALENNDDMDDSGYHDLAKFSGAEVLDAFVYGEFDVLDMPLDVRLGKQVVSWGESTFIHGGVNQINPVDISSFRRPGAEIKEGLIPVNMAFASIGISDNLSAETFYQLDFQETVTEGCGTFFSTNDFQPDGCNAILTPAGEISRNIDGNRRSDSDGQFGVAFRYFSETLDTEFGFYAMNIHSRSPLISGEKSTFDEYAFLTSGSPVLGAMRNELTSGSAADSSVYDQLVAANDAYIAASTAALMNPNDAIAVATADATAAATAEARQALAEVNVGLLSILSTNNGAAIGVSPQTYYIDYPEDQQIAGISFATNVGSIALSGEFSHKLDVPLQINSVTLMTASVQSDATYAYVYNAMGGAANQVAANEAARAAVFGAYGSLGIDILDIEDGTGAAGYRSFDVSQAQFTAIKLIDQILGASQIAIVGEMGYTYIHDFESDIPFSGDEFLNDVVTESSWGYRTRIIAKYNDAFAGVNLSPVLAWSEDVSGISPAPGGNFIEGQQVLSFSLNAEYQNMYTSSISYTQYSGGTTNQLSDRDFASFTLGMQF
ncbi:MAG: DUF1302 domain-containing protein [Bermanella sp.]